MNDPFRITAEEYQLILETFSFRYGPGYSTDSKVCRLQAKLSLMAEAAFNAEQAFATDRAKKDA